MKHIKKMRVIKNLITLPFSGKGRLGANLEQQYLGSVDYNAVDGPKAHYYPVLYTKTNWKILSIMVSQNERAYSPYIRGYIMDNNKSEEN